MTYTHIYNFYPQTYTSAYTHRNILLNLSTVIFTYKQIYIFIYTFIIHMNTHNYINKTPILSFLSIVHSYINITILNTCKQIYVLVLIEIYIVTHVYKKNKAKLSTSHCTSAKVLSTKTASDCSLTSFRLLQKLSFSCPIWLNKMKSTNIIFESSFIAKNPFHAILGLQKTFEIFFQKITKFLYVSTPHTS